MAEHRWPLPLSSSCTDGGIALSNIMISRVTLINHLSAHLWALIPQHMRVREGRGRATVNLWEPKQWHTAWNYPGTLSSHWDSWSLCSWKLTVCLKKHSGTAGKSFTSMSNLESPIEPNLHVNGLWEEWSAQRKPHANSEQKDQRTEITKVITIHPRGRSVIFIKPCVMTIHPTAVKTFYPKPTMSVSWHCFREMSADHQSQQDLSTRDCTCLYKQHLIQPYPVWHSKHLNSHTTEKACIMCISWMLPVVREDHIVF